MASAGGDSSGEECGLQIDVGKADGRQSKPRGKGAKVTKAVEVSWKPGDIVWAKVSGFNYWPAKIFDPSSVPKWLREPPKPNYILVRFFGSYDIQWVSQRLIEDYEKGFKKKFQTKSRSKLFQKSVKEVREYVEDGITPDGLVQPVNDPDAHSGSEGEEEGEREGEKEGEGKASDTEAAVSGNDQPPPKTKETTKRKKVAKVKESAPEAVEQPQTSSSSSSGSGVGVSQSSSSTNNNGSRSRRRKGSPRKLSSSSVDNMDEGNAPKKAKLETVKERGMAEGSGDGAAKGDGGTGKEEIQAFTSAPLPLTANSKKSHSNKTAKSTESKTAAS